MSSVSSITSSNYTLTLDSTSSSSRNEARKKTTQALADLSEALESGDLEAAKTAFATLKESMPQPSSESSSSNTGTSDNENPMAKDFKALSEALESGDMEAAQEAFETIESHLKNPPPPPPAGGPGGSKNDSDEDEESNSTLQLLQSLGINSSTSNEDAVSLLLSYLSENGTTATDSSETGQILNLQA